MTTVAWDGEILAADTAAVISGRSVRYEGKLRRFDNGFIGGLCGALEPCLEAMDFLNECDCEPDGWERPSISGGGEIVVVTLDRKVILFNTKKLVRVTLKEAKYAMGSGGDIALGAMMAGAGAPQAVRYAIERDPNSGFDVVFMGLD